MCDADGEVLHGNHVVVEVHGGHYHSVLDVASRPLGGEGNLIVGGHLHVPPEQHSTAAPACEWGQSVPWEAEGVDVVAVVVHNSLE